jgi:hypothetical protein
MSDAIKQNGASSELYAEMGHTDFLEHCMFFVYSKGSSNSFFKHLTFLCLPKINPSYKLSGGLTPAANSGVLGTLQAHINLAQLQSRIPHLFDTHLVINNVISIPAVIKVDNK